MLTIEAYPLACPSRAALVDRALAGDPEARASVVGAVLSELALRHPGHSPQKVHGRRGPAAAALKALDGPEQDDPNPTGWTKLSLAGSAMIYADDNDTSFEEALLLNESYDVRNRGRLGPKLVYRDEQGRSVELSAAACQDRGVVSGLAKGMAVAPVAPGHRVRVGVEILPQGVGAQTDWRDGHHMSTITVNSALLDKSSYLNSKMVQAHEIGYHMPLPKGSHPSDAVIEQSVAHEYAHALDNSYGRPSTNSAEILSGRTEQPISARYMDGVESRYMRRVMSDDTEDSAAASISYFDSVVSGYGNAEGPAEAFADAFAAVAVGSASREVASLVRGAV